MYSVNTYKFGVDFVLGVAGLTDNIILRNQTIRRHIGTVVVAPDIKLDITVNGCALNLCASGQKKKSIGLLLQNNGRSFIIKGRTIT